MLRRKHEGLCPTIPTAIGKPLSSKDSLHFPRVLQLYLYSLVLDRCLFVSIFLPLCRCSPKPTQCLIIWGQSQKCSHSTCEQWAGCTIEVLEYVRLVVVFQGDKLDFRAVHSWHVSCDWPQSVSTFIIFPSRLLTGLALIPLQ